MGSEKRRYRLDTPGGFVTMETVDGGVFDWGRFLPNRDWVTPFDLDPAKHRDLIGQVLREGRVVFGEDRRRKRINLKRRRRR